MGGVTETMRDHYRRSADRARQVLKPGDKIRLRICGGGEATYRMTGWQGDCLDTPGGDDLHPFNVVRVNGVLTSFRDPET